VDWGYIIGAGIAAGAVILNDLLRARRESAERKRLSYAEARSRLEAACYDFVLAYERLRAKSPGADPALRDDLLAAAARLRILAPDRLLGRLRILDITAELERLEPGSLSGMKRDYATWFVAEVREYLDLPW